MGHSSGASLSYALSQMMAVRGGLGVLVGGWVYGGRVYGGWHGRGRGEVS